MIVALVFSGSGPLVIMTNHDGLEDPTLLDMLRRKGIRKFLAFPVPESLAREKYGTHYDIVCHDVHETDELRVLDFNGGRALELLPFAALGEPIFHEGVAAATA